MRLTHSKITMLLLLGGLIISPIFFNSCSTETAEKVDSRSLEQIYEDEGVPVKVVKVSETELANKLVFFATMSGIQETTLLSKIQDKIVTLPVKVGQAVSEGQIVATFPTDNPQLQWEQAKAALDIAKKTYDRMSALLKAGDISQAQFDGAETQYEVAKQNFESLKKMVYIDAPFSGIITNIAAKVGDKVNSGATLMTIAKVETMVAQIWAKESEVRQLKIGMPATIHIDGKKHTGRIATIALSMDTKKYAFLVEVHFPNPRREIKSGTSCDLVFDFDAATKQTIVIPRRIIKTNADEQFVFIADGDVAKKCIVQTGKISGINIEVVSGLNANDNLITEGMFLLEDGKKIKIIE